MVKAGIGGAGKEAVGLVVHAVEVVGVVGAEAAVVGVHGHAIHVGFRLAVICMIVNPAFLLEILIMSGGCPNRVFFVGILPGT